MALDKPLRPLLAAAACTVALLSLLAAVPTTAWSATCDDYNGGFFGRHLSRTNTILWNELTFLTTMDHVKVRARLLDAADTWNASINACNMTPRTGARMTVEPGAYASASDRPDGQNYNGRNQLAFGPIAGAQWGPGCDVAGVIACAPVNVDATGHIRETDVQFDSRRYFWGGRESTPGGNANDTYVPDNWYDLWGIAAHEFGHTLGESHTPPNIGSNLTMRPQFCMGSNETPGDPSNCNSSGGSSANARTLGPGDLYWYEQNYRQTP